MNLAIFLDLLKIILPSLIVLGGMLLLVKSFLREEREKRSLELKLKTITKMLPLRLNAYERMILFIERSNPSSLLLRIYQTGISARDLQVRALDELRTEFNHNLSQQIYITEDAWEIVLRIKEESSFLINDQMARLPQGANGAELSRRILEKQSQMDIDPYSFATKAIKQEVRQLF